MSSRSQYACSLYNDTNFEMLILKLKVAQMSAKISRQNIIHVDSIADFENDLQWAMDMTRSFFYDKKDIRITVILNKNVHAFVISLFVFFSNFLSHINNMYVIRKRQMRLKAWWGLSSSSTPSASLKPFFTCWSNHNVHTGLVRLIFSYLRNYGDPLEYEK